MFKPLIFFLLLGSITSNAQKAPFKFGKLDISEMDIDSCDFYPEAHSMVLGEFGNINFIYSDLNNSFKYQIEVLVRKKIFKKTDKDAGNFTIKFYEPVIGSSREEISGLKGITYNIVDGKLKETKLQNSAKFETRINDRWKQIAVTMPDVQEGSVIEYTYTKTSDFVSTLTTWYFQQDIPVKYSELRVALPEWYNYQMNNVGAVQPLEVEDTYKNEDFRFTYKVANNSATGQTRFASVTSRSKYRRMIARNVTPIPDEPYMNNEADVPNRLEFQLISIHMPESPIQNIAQDYAGFNDQLMRNARFGERLNNGNFANDFIKKLEGKDELEKAASIYSWLQNHFSWDKFYGFTSDKAGRPAFNDAKGSVSDINLSLIAAFKEAGLEAHPVILSTRGSGIPHPIYPSYDDFNYVVALVKATDTYYFVDATSNLPFGILPVRCLNGQGRLVSDEGGSWVNLKQNQGYTSTATVKSTISDGQIMNQIAIKNSGYAAIDLSEDLATDGEDKYKESLASEFPEWDLDNFEIKQNNITDGIHYQFNLNKELEGDDILYIQPMLVGMDTDNIFKREERFSPVDFPYTLHKKVINIISFPEGYTAELPETGVYAMPDNAGKFVYSVSQAGNNISILSEVILNKTLFGPNEYPILKQFYQIMSEKNSSVIVLKKL